MNWAFNTSVPTVYDNFLTFHVHWQIQAIDFIHFV